MVYVKDNFLEEIQDVSIITKNNMKYVNVISEQGYFEYYIPIVDVPYYARSVTDNDKILDLGCSDARIIEAPNSDNRDEYDGFSNITVPKNVMDAAKEKTGLDYLE